MEEVILMVAVSEMRWFNIFRHKTGDKMHFRMHRPRKVDPFIFYYYFTNAISWLRMPIVKLAKTTCDTGYTRSYIKPLQVM